MIDKIINKLISDHGLMEYSKTMEYYAFVPFFNFRFTDYTVKKLNLCDIIDDFRWSVGNELTEEQIIHEICLLITGEDKSYGQR